MAERAVPAPDRAWLSGRLAIVGIGSDLNGDDGAGVLIARRLLARVGPRPDLLILDGGVAPENLTGTLRRFAPDTVLLADAADFGAAAGTVAWLPWEDGDGWSGSTHTLPPSLLARFLAHELGCRVVLLGIQPASLEFGTEISPDVGAAIDVAARLLETSLA